MTSLVWSAQHAELGLLVGHKDAELSSAKKKKRTFSFLSKKRASNHGQ